MNAAKASVPRTAWRVVAEGFEEALGMPDLSGPDRQRFADCFQRASRLAARLPLSAEDPNAVDRLRSRALVDEESLKAIRRNCIGKADPLAQYCVAMTDHLDRRT